MRGTKNYSFSELKHLKPFKTIILDTETAVLVLQRLKLFFVKELF
jgi:hypothetical protein